MTNRRIIEALPKLAGHQLEEIGKMVENYLVFNEELADTRPTYCLKCGVYGEPFIALFATLGEHSGADESAVVADVWHLLKWMREDITQESALSEGLLVI